MSHFRATSEVGVRILKSVAFGRLYSSLVFLPNFVKVE
jgi:hypothetical protein